MIKIKAFVSMGLVGCKREEIIEVENDDDIDEAVREWMFNEIEWSWEKVEEPANWPKKESE